MKINIIVTYSDKLIIGNNDKIEYCTIFDISLLDSSSKLNTCLKNPLADFLSKLSIC